MSFPRYQKYKDAGIEWLGEVPEHWVVMTLGRVTTEKCDGPFGSGLKSEHYVEHGVRVVRLQNIRRDGFDGSDAVFISEMYFDEELTRHDVQAGDVLIAGLGDERNTVGRACVAPSGIEPAMVKADCFRFRLLTARALPTFVALQLTAGSAADAGLLATGSTRSRIPLSVMASRRIALPPTEEQAAITTFMGAECAKIDTLVAEQQRLIEVLKEKRQAVIAHVVTKGLNWGVPTKSSGVEWLGDVPAHWEIVRLANAFREATDPGNDELPVLSVSIHDGVSARQLDEAELDRKVTRSEDRSKYKRVAPGDLVYNMMRAWQGGFGTVAVDGLVSPAYVVARPKQKVNTAFIEYLLRTPHAVEQMRRHSQGVTDFRLRLYWDEFKNIRIALPPLSESVAICQEIAAMEKSFNRLTAEAQRAVALLHERRNALISAAVTGKIDVRGLAGAEGVAT